MPAESRGDADDGIRLQKVLAESGVGSRRASEELIRQGRVHVNGVRAHLGQRVTDDDRVEVDGSLVRVQKSKRYYALNKPEGVVTSSKDPEGRPTVIDLIGAEERVYPVGRLDMATEGLLLLTNDGELANRLTHPSFEVPKKYLADVVGSVDRGGLRKLVDPGVRVDQGRPARALSAKVVASTKGRSPRSSVEITLHEGRKHVVRLMLEAIGHPVTRLVRTAVGPIRLGRLAPGTYRALTPAEVDALYLETGLKADTAARGHEGEVSAHPRRQRSNDRKGGL